MALRRLGGAALATAALCTAALLPTLRATSSAPVHAGLAARAALATVPMAFEQNKGQTDRRVRFLARGPGYATFLTERGSVLALQRGRKGAVVRTRFLGAAHARPVAEGKLPGILNAFEGPRARWRTDIATYSRVRYPSIYPGISAIYHG